MVTLTHLQYTVIFKGRTQGGKVTYNNESLYTHICDTLMANGMIEKSETSLGFTTYTLSLKGFKEKINVIKSSIDIKNDKVITVKNENNDRH